MTHVETTTDEAGGPTANAREVHGQLHVLVVEDDENALLGLRRLVEREGCTTEGATTLSEARARLEERAAPPTGREPG